MYLAVRWLHRLDTIERSKLHTPTLLCPLPPLLLGGELDENVVHRRVAPVPACAVRPFVPLDEPERPPRDLVKPVHGEHEIRDGGFRLSFIVKIDASQRGRGKVAAQVDGHGALDGKIRIEAV